MSRVFLAIATVCVALIIACGDATPTPTTLPTAIATSDTPTPPTPTPIPPPVASFSVDVVGGSAPVTVKFTDTSQGNATEWKWDFGDGASSMDQSPTHSYTIAGTHDVTLTVIEPGGTDTSAMAGLVTIEAGPPANIEISPTTATIPVQESTQFTAVAMDEFGNVVPSTFDWMVDRVGGSITSQGLFTADTVAGTFSDIVVASLMSGILNGAGSVIIQPGPLSEVSIAPTEAILEIEATTSFTFQAKDQFGNEITDALVLWTIQPDLGTIDDAGRLTTGTQAGSFQGAIVVDAVKDTHRSSAIADLTVNPGPLDSVEIVPSLAILGMGESARLRAVGSDRFGNVIRGLECLWESDGILRIDQLGNVSTEEPSLIGPTAGLVSWWPGDGNANDIVGGSNGTLQSGATFLPGIVGEAFSFDGVDDYVQVSHERSLMPTTALTLAAWIYATSKSVGPSQDIIDKHIHSGDFDNSGYILRYIHNQVRITLMNDGWNGATDPQELPLNTWVHYAGTFDGTRLKLYRTGALVADRPATGVRANTRDVYIGRGWAAFQRVIDDVRLYSRAITPEEVKNLYVAGPEGRYTVRARGISNGIERPAIGEVLVVDLPFPIQSSVPATVAQGSAANAILADVLGGKRVDFATLPEGAAIDTVSSGLFGSDPCTDPTSRFPCSDPRDVIDRSSQYSIYDDPSETTFIFGPVTPQTLIVDLGEVRELESIGADFTRYQSDRGVASFGVFVSLDGTTYTPLSAPIDNPSPPTFFTVDAPVRARYVAYYFGNCSGSDCPGSRVSEVYAVAAEG